MKKIKKAVKRVYFLLLGFFITREYFEFRSGLEKSGRKFEISYGDMYPCLFDKTSKTAFERHYLYHVAWAVRCVKELNPAAHVDIGSSLYFCSTLSAFIPTDFYDYRPAEVKLSGLRSLHGDLTKLPFKDGEVPSLSCLHTIEHIGLGRYGDPIDALGDLKAIRELSRVTAKGGTLLIVVPTGRISKVQFNGHRIYSYDDLVSYFPDFTLRKFSYIPEKEERGGLIDRAIKDDIGGDDHGCACYWFVKQ